MKNINKKPVQPLQNPVRPPSFPVQPVGLTQNRCDRVNRTGQTPSSRFGFQNIG
ncbi:hypothetical protein HanPSC8_Chr01g0011141 [Helianthus annuus]|nr:hypothetical protein HanPSC8_Chr01g0011141 [Helianthus annuus]